jgi:HEAT repeat protein
MMASLIVRTCIALMLLGLLPLSLESAEDPAATLLTSSQVQAIISRLKTDDEWQRDISLQEIRRYIHEGNPKLFSEIINLLNGDVIHRRVAIKTLKAIISPFDLDKSVERPTMEAIINHLSDSDDYVRNASVEVLSRLENIRDTKLLPLPLLKKRFEEESLLTTKINLLHLIVKVTIAVDHKVEAEHLLEEALSQPGAQPELRSAALRELSTKSLLSLGGFRTILTVLQDKHQNVTVRLAAISALSQAYERYRLDLYLKDQAKITCAILTAALKDSSQPRVQSAVASALSTLGPLASPTVEALKEVFSTSTSKRVRINCAQALGAIGTAAHSATPDLLAALNDSDSDLKVAAISALGNVNEQHEKPSVVDKEEVADAVTVLRRLFRENDNPQTRSVAIEALGKIRSPYALPELRAALRANAQLEAQGSAVVAIGNLKEAAKDAEGDLRNLVTSDNPGLVSATLSALALIGADSSETVHTLAGRFNDNDLYYNAAETLSDIGKRNPEAITVLTEKLADEESRERATLALRNLALTPERN